jgi:hypothetical protein
MDIFIGFTQGLQPPHDMWDAAAWLMVLGFLVWAWLRGR